MRHHKTKRLCNSACYTCASLKHHQVTLSAMRTAALSRSTALMRLGYWPVRTNTLHSERVQATLCLRAAYRSFACASTCISASRSRTELRCNDGMPEHSADTLPAASSIAKCVRVEDSEIGVSHMHVHFTKWLVTTDTVLASAAAHQQSFISARGVTVT
jgi:hypothetical protein